jgi:hypothetical protein
VYKENEVDCDSFEKYVKNRDKYLERVMDKYDVDRDAAKQLFIRLLYFGSFQNWKDDNDIESNEESSFIKNYAK